MTEQLTTENMKKTKKKQNKNNKKQKKYDSHPLPVTIF